MGGGPSRPEDINDADILNQIEQFSKQINIIKNSESYKHILNILANYQTNSAKIKKINMSTNLSILEITYFVYNILPAFNDYSPDSYEQLMKLQAEHNVISKLVSYSQNFKKDTTQCHQNQAMNNSRQISMGAYGGTKKASKTPRKYPKKA